jgi:hypothetical protein
MVLIDATTLLLLLDPDARPPRDPATKKPLENCKERIEFLIETLSEAGSPRRSANSRIERAFGASRGGEE